MMEFSYYLGYIFSRGPLRLQGSIIYEVGCNSLIVCYAVELYMLFTAVFCKINILLLGGGGEGLCQQDFPASGHMLKLYL